jgi:hypothetical protein
MTLSTAEPSPTSQTPQTDLSFLDARALEEKFNGWATWVSEEYRKCKSARNSIEIQWYLNMAFYYGNQYVAVLGQQNALLGEAAGKLITPKAPPWRTRMVVNRVRAAIRSEHAKITAQKPNASVVPASSEDEDLFAAQAAEQIWESTYSRLKIAKEFRRAAFWQVITGNGFLKCYWDKTAVDKNNPTARGDICVLPVTPFHIFVPDLREEDIEKQPYVLNVYTRPLAQVQEQYRAELAGKDLRASVVSQNEIIEDARLNLASGSKPDSVLCYEAWLKPGAHPDFPQGGLLQVVDKFVVNFVDTGIPYQHGEYPFIHFTHIPSGKFYSTSVVEDLISLQKEYNRTRSQVIEAKNRMAKPQLIAPKGSVDPSKITTEPGQLIEYRPGMTPPQPLPLQPIPSYVLQEMDRTLMDIEDITSQHQVSKGNVPTGVTAATAISYLQERDDSVLSPTYTAVEEGMEKLARHVLSHVVQYWDSERTVLVTGDDQSFDTLVLKGAKIANGQDIRMEGGSSLPVSKAARQAFLMDMMKFGFIPPEQGLRLMEIGGVQKLYEQLQIDERQAQRENLKMKMMGTDLILNWEQQKSQAEAFSSQVQQLMNADPTSHGLPSDFPALPTDFPGNTPPQGGMGAPTDPTTPPLPGMENPAGSTTSLENGTIQSTQNVDPATGLPVDLPLLVPVNTWDNHAIHIEVHNRFRKSQAFEKLDDEHKRLFEAHVSLHAAALNGAAQAAMMGGAPPDILGQGGGLPPESGQGNNQFTPPTGAQNG